MGELIGIAIVAATVFAGWACIHWVLGPLTQTAKCQQLPLQFGLADFLCLFAKFTGQAHQF